MELSADFRRFADFAAAPNGGRKNIADAANGEFNVGKLHRSVVSSSGDKVGAFSRSQTAKDVNNITRDVFLKTVTDMFNGNIPNSVKKAMNIGKFDGKGHPLTAKRILIVKTAIEKYTGNPKTDGVKAMSAASYAKDMRPVKLNQRQAEKLIASSFKLFQEPCLSETKKVLAGVLLKYGNDMPAKNQRVLSNYIANLAINNCSLTEEDVKSLADDLKTWSEFKFGDARLNGISAKFIQRHTDYVKAKINQPDSFNHKYEDKAMFEQVYSDACRGNWTINGQKFNHVPQNANGTSNDNLTLVPQAIKDAVPGDGARKMISIILNQSGLADMAHLFAKCPVNKDPANPNGQMESIHTISGGELFVSCESGLLIVDKMPSYGLEVSKDGKTATITLSVDKHLSSMGSKHNQYKIGIATITQKIKIDISDDKDPKILDVMFAQSYSPDKLWIDENQKGPSRL